MNYIRHHLTTYDDELVGIGGKTGKDAAYYELKKAILEKIAETYPKYAAECAEQIQTIEMPKPW